MFDEEYPNRVERRVNNYFLKLWVNYICRVFEITPCHINLQPKRRRPERCPHICGITSYERHVTWNRILLTKNKCRTKNRNTRISRFLQWRFGNNWQLNTSAASFTPSMKPTFRFLHLLAFVIATRYIYGPFFEMFET